MKIKSPIVSPDIVFNRIQQDMMPKWSSVEEAEKQSLSSILNRWQVEVTAQFERDKLKNISIKPFDENRMEHLNNALNSDFKSKTTSINSLAFDVFQACGDTTEKTKENEINMKPNTRLILKAFRKFNLAFECLENSQVESKEVILKR